MKKFLTPNPGSWYRHPGGHSAHRMCCYTILHHPAPYPTPRDPLSPKKIAKKTARNKLTIVDRNRSISIDIDRF